MRVLTVLVIVVAFAASATFAHGARKPTPKEQAAVTLAVILQLPHIEGTAAVFVVRRVVVSTVQPGGRAAFSRFALASGIAKDQSGLYPGGARKALVGLHRRRGNWIVVDWGVARVGCTGRPSFFGGRRTAILRDLGIRCT